MPKCVHIVWYMAWWTMSRFLCRAVCANVLTATSSQDFLVASCFLLYRITYSTCSYAYLRTYFVRLHWYSVGSSLMLTKHWYYSKRMRGYYFKPQRFRPSSVDSPLSSSTTLPLFHSRLKTACFTSPLHHRLSFSLTTDSTDCHTDRISAFTARRHASAV